MFETEAFLGTYDLYVEYNDRIIAKEFELDKDGMKITFNLEEKSYPLPVANLKISNEKSTIPINEPIGIAAISDVPIKTVIFKNDHQILGVSTEKITFTPNFYGVLKLSAEIECENGYRLTILYQEITTSDKRSKQ